VEVLDTLTNEIINYSSTREAARAIGCAFYYLSSAPLRELREPEVYKQRYMVKAISPGE